MRSYAPPISNKEQAEVIAGVRRSPTDPLDITHAIHSAQKALSSPQAHPDPAYQSHILWKGFPGAPTSCCCGGAPASRLLWELEWLSSILPLPCAGSKWGSHVCSPHMTVKFLKARIVLSSCSYNTQCRLSALLIGWLSINHGSFWTEENVD